MGLHFDEEIHKYKWEDKWLHLSPTQVLSIDLDDEAKQRIAETKDGQMVGRSAGILFMVALSSICLGAAELDPEPSPNGGSPLNRAAVGKTAR